MIPVRRIVADDWRAWRAMRRRALAEDPGAFAPSTATWTGADDVEQRWRERIDGSLGCFLAVGDDDEPVGMVAADPGPAGEVVLASMWVAPEARRSGVGRALVDAVVDVADGAPVRLRVMPDNAAAVAAYERAGFVPEPGEPDGEGCAAMRRLGRVTP